MFYCIAYLRYHCLLLCGSTNLDILFSWQQSTASPIHSFIMVVSTNLESDEFEKNRTLGCVQDRIRIFLLHSKDEYLSNLFLK